LLACLLSRPPTLFPAALMAVCSWYMGLLHVCCYISFQAFMAGIAQRIIFSNLVRWFWRFGGMWWLHFQGNSVVQFDAFLNDGKRCVCVHENSLTEAVHISCTGMRMVCLMLWKYYCMEQENNNLVLSGARGYLYHFSRLCDV
jgi:hypothetical protein